MICPKGNVPPNKGHKHGAHREVYLYDIWNSRTDELLAVAITAAEASDILGIKRRSFYSYVQRSRKGQPCWLHIEPHYVDEPEEDDEDVDETDEGD